MGLKNKWKAKFKKLYKFTNRKTIFKVQNVIYTWLHYSFYMVACIAFDIKRNLV